MSLKNPASLMRYPRLKLQAMGEVPPTYGRVASFAEQGMAKNVNIREQHPVISILDYIKDASVFYSKQVQLSHQRKSRMLKFSIYNMRCLVLENNKLLTPYADKHLQLLKSEASKYSVAVIKDDEYTVWRKSENYRPHLVNWSLRSCSNCHHYSETLLPCVHLYAVWIHHKAKGLITKTHDGQSIKITTTDDAWQHLFGKCYLSTTLKSVITHVSNVRPVSLDSISQGEIQGSLMLTKKVTKGRPQVKRIASNCDNHRTGKKQRFNQLRDIKSIDNLTVSNDIDPI